jgi:hypothetical protein
MGELFLLVMVHLFHLTLCENVKVKSYSEVGEKKRAWSSQVSHPISPVKN